MNDILFTNGFTFAKKREVKPKKLCRKGNRPDFKKEKRV